MMINGAVEVITASIVAGLTQHAALHPLDTLKVRLQAESAGAAPPRYGSMGNALRLVVAEEGVLALWNGFPAYYLRCGGHTMTMFVFVQWLRQGLM